VRHCWLRPRNSALRASARATVLRQPCSTVNHTLTTLLRHTKGAKVDCNVQVPKDWAPHKW